MSFEKRNLAEAEKKIGYHFNNPNLLAQAFTRSSYAKENGKESNEVLEFFGDKILSRYIVKRIAEVLGNKDRNQNEGFAIQNHEMEGALSYLHNTLVSNKHLATRTEQLGLFQYRFLGKGEKTSQNEKKPKADLIEAIRGAVAIDSNWNDTVIEIVRNKLLEIDSFIQSWDFSSKNKELKNPAKTKEKVLEAAVPETPKLNLRFSNQNATSVLFEQIAKHKYPKIKWSFTEVKKTKERIEWECHYKMEGSRLSGKTIAKKKKQARKLAAYEILTFLTKKENK